MFLNSIKISFLFIGTVIGAGFSSGREIFVFFGKTSPFIACFAGVFCALMCYVFLYAGSKTENLSKACFGKLDTAFEYGVFISMFITFGAMWAGSESIVFQALNISGGGLISAIIVVFLSIFSMKMLKNMNFLLVPFIVAFIILIFVRNKIFEFDFSFEFHNAVGYIAMNMLGGGYIIAGEGKKCGKKERVTVSLLVGIFMTAMLYMILMSVQNYGQYDMPLLKSAQNVGLNLSACALIYLSIFTTMLSSAKVLFDKMKAKIRSVSITCSILLLCGLLISLIGFANIVDYLYPMSSVLGVIYVAAVIVFLLRLKIRRAYVTPKTI